MTFNLVAIVVIVVAAIALVIGILILEFIAYKRRQIDSEFKGSICPQFPPEEDY